MANIFPSHMVFAKGEGDKQIWMAKSCLFAGVPRKGGGGVGETYLVYPLSLPQPTVCIYILGIQLLLEVNIAHSRKILFF